ncbi:hypothetical protein [Schlesneria paludicola]|uniref:hypothetical protein n=1 Tax=Schlesneria paludicola TaxID=360056 RepID=UPI00029A3938|nr:hypothetical protein [Schlesneria paludicola]
MKRNAQYFGYAIVGYIVICMLELLFVAVTFGILPAIGVSLITTIPVAVGLRMLGKLDCTQSP